MKRIVLILSVLSLAVSGVNFTFAQTLRNPHDNRCWIVEPQAAMMDPVVSAHASSDLAKPIAWFNDLRGLATTQWSTLTKSFDNNWEVLQCHWHAVSRPWYNASIKMKDIIHADTCSPFDEYWAYYAACDHWSVSWGPAFKSVAAESMNCDSMALDPLPQITLIVLRPVAWDSTSANTWKIAVEGGLDRIAGLTQFYFDQTRQWCYRSQFAVLKFQQVAIGAEFNSDREIQTQATIPFLATAWTISRAMIQNPQLRSDGIRHIQSSVQAMFSLQKRFQDWCGGWQWQQLKLEFETY